MIELFNGSTSAQTEAHYSTIRTLIPVVDTTIETDSDFCTCQVQCIPALKFLTDEIGDDEYNNDWFTMYQNSISGGSHELFIVVNDQEIQVTDNTYGQEYEGANFYGYRFDAYNIWDEHGYGDYYFIMRKYDASANLVETETSATFKLQKFTKQTANGTVAIETRKNGSLRHGKKYHDLSMNVGKNLQYWTQRVRLPGRLKWAGAPVELSGVVMNNITQTRQQVFDTMTLEYDLEIHLVSGEQILPVIFDDMFANIVYVTDYNVFNFESYKKLRLLRTGIEIKPRVVKRKSFTFKMISEEKKYEKYND